MSKEALARGNEVQTVSDGEASRQGGVPTVVDHKVEKEAEVKLKEMSRRAKERKTTQSTASRRPPQRHSDTNLRLILVGGIGMGVLGILYLMLRKPKEEWVFTQNDNSEKPKKQDKEEEPPVRTSSGESTRKMTKPEFELNSF